MGIFDALTGLSPEQNEGLLGFASQLLGADPRQPANFGAALQAGIQGTAAARQRKMEQEQAQAIAAMRALQLRQATGEADSQQRIQQAALAASAGGQFDQDAFLGAVQRTDPLEAIKLRQQLAKAAPKFDSGITFVNGPDGRPVAVRTADDGSVKQVDGLAPREKAELVNLGGSSVAINPFDVKPGQNFQRTMTPGETASNGIARANLGISQQRLALEQRAQAGGAKAPAGYRWTPSGQLQAIPGGPADAGASKEGVQKVQDARDVLSILDEAEPLLSKSTSSYAGAGVDQLARVFGASTAGGDAAAQLKVLQGQLVAKQPKMSGPQSDKDVQLYREMAGQIGDPTLPESTRRAAAQTIRKVSEKYLSSTGTAPAKASGGWSIKKVGQ